MDRTMIPKYRLNVVLVIALLVIFAGSVCFAVTTKITRHNNSSDLLKGKTENVIISSRGTITLGRSADVLLDKFDGITDVWSINSMVTSGDTLYFGTSPNGGIYKYAAGTLTRLYPAVLKDPNKPKEPNQPDISKSQVKPASVSPGEAVKAKDYLTNEHIFAMAVDASGRLLAGISGNKSRLCRFEADKMETIFEAQDSKYIFAITLDGSGSIFLGTGPKGKIYRLNASGSSAQVIYESRDKNILSLAIGKDGYLYAGSDSRGVIYKIEPHGNQATVLYDSEQPEIVALLYGAALKSSGAAEPNTAGDSDIYAAATLAQVIQTQTKFASSVTESSSPGRPENDEKDGDEKDSIAKDKESVIKTSEGGQKLEVANTKETTTSKPDTSSQPVRRGTRATTSSHIYRISKDGYVTDVFTENVVLFCLAQQGGKLFLGTGNTGQVFCVEPALERTSVIYEDPQATQITSMVINGQDIYLGTANPPKVIKLTTGYAKEGTYVSDLIDAEQPAQWGKLQLEADIPAGCKVLVSSRSGNVKDVNDPTFSKWTEPEEVTKPVQLQCPVGRFCQYKLVLRSDSGSKSPQIREVAVAGTIPNLAPKVNSIDISRLEAQNKQGVLKISFNASDDNNDKLSYTIDFRKIGRTSWIKLKEDLETNSYEWDAKTVEDGKYEIRVTANDFKSNSTSTCLTGSRVSNPVTVDNTPPAPESPRMRTEIKDSKKYMIVTLTVKDELSAIGKLEYTIDSNESWLAAVPDDLVYDTTSESFTIRIDYEKYLPKGEHVLTLKIADAVGNNVYKTYDITAE
jgi:hypothetical protein